MFRRCTAYPVVPSCVRACMHAGAVLGVQREGHRVILVCLWKGGPETGEGVRPTWPKVPSLRVREETMEGNLEGTAARRRRRRVRCESTGETDDERMRDAA